MVIVKHNIQHPKRDRDMHLRRQNPCHSLLESPLNRSLVDIRGLLEVPHSERFLRDGAARHILMVHLPWPQEQSSEAISQSDLAMPRLDTHCAPLAPP